MTSGRTWWERYPHVWEREAEALRRRRLAYQVVDSNGPDGRTRTVFVTWSRKWPGEGSLQLECRFPGSYPWFGPTVIAPQMRRLPHHVSPEGEVCLLAESSTWSPTSTLAELLLQQLPRVFRTADTRTKPSELARLEAVNAEPLTANFPYMAGTSLLAALPFAVPEGPCGALSLRAPRGRAEHLIQAVVGIGPGPTVATGAMDEAQDRWLLGWVTPAQCVTLHGGWVRFARAPSLRQPVHKVFARAWAQLPHEVRARLEKQRVAVILALFPDEVGWRERGESLVALVRYAPRRSQRRYWYAPVRRADGSVARQRVPEAEVLANGFAVVVGGGALGGPAALELARSGVADLVVVDEDVVEPANVVRQLPGLAYVGAPKSLALQVEITRHAPDVRVTGVHATIGRHHERFQREFVGLLAVADVVCDLSANPAVTRYLAAHSRAAGVALVVGSATSGAWGGTVVRLLPGLEGACWQCVELHWRDGRLPRPPAAPAPVPAQGCSSASFTGSAVDLAAVWQQVVRVAIGEVSVRSSAPPGRMPADVWVMAQRDSKGRPMPVRWTARRLQQHPECWRHPPGVKPGRQPVPRRTQGC